MSDPTDLVRARLGRELAQLRWSEICPRRFATAALDDFAPMVSGPLAQWATEPGGRNLVICGPVGTGKTHAAFAAVQQLIFDGVDAAFWPVVELLDQLRPGGPDGVLERAMECEVLVLDDLGAERVTDWTAERLYAIVNRRWMAQRSIVATTNHPNYSVLAEHVGERLASRLVTSETVVMRLTGDDKRRTPTKE